jgi:hypothetical protein
MCLTLEINVPMRAKTNIVGSNQLRYSASITLVTALASFMI